MEFAEYLSIVSAVIVGCFLYDLLMNAVMRFRAKRALKALTGGLDLTALMEARLNELEGESK